MKKLIIFGTGEYAEVAHYYFKNEGKYKIEYFTIDKKYYSDNKFLGLEVKIFEEIEKNIFEYEDYYFFVAIGSSNQNQNRKNIYEKLDINFWIEDIKKFRIESEKSEKIRESLIETKKFIFLHKTKSKFFSRLKKVKYYLRKIRKIRKIKKLINS